MDELKVVKFADLMDRSPRPVIRWRKKGVIKEYSHQEIEK